MSDVGQRERRTQDRVVRLFQQALGYHYLGNWAHRTDNANVETELLTRNLRARGYDDNLINRALHKLTSDASLGGSCNLYEANRDVYGLLRYGVKVRPGIGEQTETVWLIDWAQPEANHFAVAEEVTVLGQHTKRPDIVLYVNGIAVATLELKRSKVAVSEGIRQTIGNQRPEFIRPFFTTVQLVLAGNDVEGLRYGVIDTAEKYWLRWREPSDITDPLDRDLTQLCAKARLLELVHDFTVFDAGTRKTCRHGEFITALRAGVPPDFRAKGNIFVFVDEAHRTQSGTLHDAMQALLPGALFIGFTGTPLLKVDKTTSIETFGRFIHTYRFDEAVADGVVLDLRYEARTIDQELTSPTRVDQWFEARTREMTDLSRAELKKRWGTMQKVVSAEPRARQIVGDVLLDMQTRPRLLDGRGNAMLVSSSIYQACKFYELFCQAGFTGRCAIVTSYAPQVSDIAKEDSGEGATERLRQYEIYRRMLADHFGEPADKAMTKVEQFETEVKQRFVKHPGQMRLLIVVDKLLTGFDAPSATYLYIDKKMQNHGLFQAICRVNRLDGDDKDYGYIIDYRDLFNSLESAITDYTGGALEGYEKDDIEGLLADRLAKGREDLDDALERVRALCEPVAPPRGTRQYQQYFCAVEQGDAEQIKANEPKRVELYKAVAAVTRAYANIATDMRAAGYSADEAAAIKVEIARYVDVRAEVKIGAGENVDFTQYEAGMRHLLDTYISATPSETISNFEDAGLIELIVRLGAGAVDKLPAGIRQDPEAVAATIANNMRKVIVDEHALNPKYYDTMSALLDAVLAERRQGALDYQAYLASLLEQARKLARGDSDTAYPQWADTGARRALVDFFAPRNELAVEVDTAVRDNKRDSWVGNPMKERRLRQDLAQVLPPDFDRLDELLELVKARHEYH